MYICSLDVIVIFYHIFHSLIDFSTDHLLLLSGNDMLLHLFGVIFFGKFVGDIESLNCFFVHLMSVNIKLFTFN